MLSKNVWRKMVSGRKVLKFFASHFSTDYSATPRFISNQSPAESTFSRTYGDTPLLLLTRNWSEPSQLHHAACFAQFRPRLHRASAKLVTHCVGLNQNTRTFRQLRLSSFRATALNFARFWLTRTWDALSRSGASKSGSASRKHLVVSPPCEQTNVRNLGSVTANNPRPISTVRKSVQPPTPCNPTCQVAIVGSSKSGSTESQMQANQHLRVRRGISTALRSISFDGHSFSQ